MDNENLSHEHTLVPPANKPTLIIVGAGMAGTRFAMMMAQRSDHYHIILINGEPHAGYNRIMLSPVLAGDKAFADIALYPKSEYDAHHITLMTSCHVTAIHPQQKHLVTDQGDTLNYDKLVLATGSSPFILPLPNHDAQGVLAFRTKADVDAMLSYAQTANSRCVVIGGGLLGLEAADALASHGAHVTVVHASAYLLNRQLDATAAALLQAHLESRGIHFAMGAQSQEILTNADHQVTGLHCLQNGSHKDSLNDAHSHSNKATEQILAADCIIMSVGVRPNIALAQHTGIQCERGILVDDLMCTSHPDIYAIGECVQFQQHVFGLVAPVYEHAQALASALLDKPEPFSVTATATKLKVSGIDLFSAGQVLAEPHQQVLVYEDTAQRVYQKLILENDRLVGAVLYGDVQDGGWFFDLIQQKTDISRVRKDLLFGQAFCQNALSDIPAEYRLSNIQAPKSSPRKDSDCKDSDGKDSDFKMNDSKINSSKTHSSNAKKQGIRA